MVGSPVLQITVYATALSSMVGSPVLPITVYATPLYVLVVDMATHDESL